MKSLLLLIVGLGVGLACGVLLFKPPQAPIAPPQFVESTPAPGPSPSPITAAPEPAPVIVETQPAPVVPIAPVANEPESKAVVTVRKEVDSLLSPQTALNEKYRLLRQIHQAGQLDQVIAALQGRATENPAAAGIPATLALAQLEKVRVLHESGADVNQVGILAMQADQNFNAALKIDPTNWEAQLVKYSTMYYWPADPARDNEAAQRLSSLIDQQEALPPQPQFAQTYVALGNQYQKLGKPEFAEATWRLGLVKFPNDPTLLQKVAATK